MEVNVIDLIGYLLQVLLLLALLICLSIRSWPLLIAIVILGFFMLGFACVRIAASRSTSNTQLQQEEGGDEKEVNQEEYQEELDPHSLIALHQFKSTQQTPNFSRRSRKKTLQPQQLMQMSTQTNVPTPHNPQPMSPFLRQSYQTTPEMLEEQIRQRRWQAQSAMPTYGVPLASQQYLVSMQTQDVYRPDPNLIPVNHTNGYPPLNTNQRNRIQRTSAWGSRAYLSR
jgi:hypothetical protein